MTMAENASEERAGGLEAVSPLLGTRAAQAAVDGLARNVQKLNDGLGRVVSGLEKVSKSSGQSRWNGNSNYAHGKSNGGGSTPYRPGQYWDQTFLGGGPQKPPTQSGGKANGGGYIMAGVAAMAGAGAANLPTMVSTNTTAQILSRTSTMPWNNVRSTIMRNNYTATDSLDAMQAGANITNLGYAVGSSQYSAAIGYNKSFGRIDPTLSATTVAAAQNRLGQGLTYNYFMGRGINLLGRGGNPMSPRDLANQMTNRMVAGNHKWTKAEAARFTTSRGAGGVAIDSMLRSGVIDQDTAAVLRSEMNAQNTAKSNGFSYDQFKTAADKGDVKALSRMGIKETDANRLKNVDAQKRNIEDNMANGFSKGLDHATDALTAFTKALNGLTHGPLGDALGYGQGMAGTLASTGGGLLAGLVGKKAVKTIGKRVLSSGGARVAGGAAGRAGAGALAEGALGLGAGTLATAGAVAGGVALPFVVAGKYSTYVPGSAPTHLDSGVGKLDWTTGHATSAFGSSLTGTDGVSGGAQTGGGGGAGGQRASKGGVAPQSAGGASAAKVIGIAMKYIGVPYKWGGTTPRGFDCSGLMQYAFGQAGVRLPRTSQQQARTGSPVSIRDVRPGDLVFPSDAHHVALVIGPGKIIEAPRTGLNVRVAALRSSFTVARRVLSSVGSVGAITGDSATSVSGDNRSQKSMPGAGGNSGMAGAGTSEASIVAGALSGFAAAAVGGEAPSAADGANGANSAAGAAGPMPSGSVGSWIKKALGLAGVDYSKYGSAIAKIIQHESGGNPRAVNNWDSNAKAGHPSKGIMQTIDSTFKAYALPGHGDIWNPVDNIVAATRYAISRYGSIDSVPGIKSMGNGGAYKGYAVGSTNVDVDQIAKVHKGEAVLDPQTAEVWRNTLKGNNPTMGLTGGGKKIVLQFNPGSIVLHASGPMNDSQATDFAKTFVRMLSNNAELQTIAEG